MKLMIEVVVTRVLENHDPTFLQQRFVPIKVEVVSERHHLDEQWIKNRINVVR
jgi:hypothetical protein